MTTDTSKIQLEIEIKLKCSQNELEKLPARLSGLGFRLIEEESYENNVVFDTPGLNLKERKMLLRLRQKSGRVILTMKRPVAEELDSDQYKIKEEIEVAVSSFEDARTIVMGLGYEEFFIYEKYRSVYQRDSEEGPVKLMLDRTPIGHFLEIEGPANLIDVVAAQLGYRKEDYITVNYYTLFRREQSTGFMQFQE